MKFFNTSFATFEIFQECGVAQRIILPPEDTRVLPSKFVLGRGSGPPMEGEIWGSEPTVLSGADCLYHDPFVTT